MYFKNKKSFSNYLQTYFARKLKKVWHSFGATIIGCHDNQTTCMVPANYTKLVFGMYTAQVCSK